MARQYINPPEVGPTPVGYNKAVQTGNKIYMAGQVAMDGSNNITAPGDINKQATATLQNMTRVLDAAGSSLQNLAMSRVYTTNMAHRDVLSEVRRANGLTQATSTLVEVNGLANPDLMFEMSGIASVNGPDKVLAPDTVHQPGGPYVHGVQIDDTVYLAGQLGVDPSGNLVGRGDAEAQAEQAVQNILSLLEAAGGSVEDVVYTCLYVTNPGYADAVRNARRKHGLNACPSTLVVIPSLAQADYLVEIEAIAVIGTEKKVIRPGNVHSVTGRYEHAIVAGETIYLAGQVGLDVDGNLVGQGDVEAQARQLYTNMERVLAAAGATYEDLVSTTVYLTNLGYREGHLKVRKELGITAPAGTTVVISALAQPEMLVEVEAIAVVGDR